MLLASVALSLLGACETQHRVLPPILNQKPDITMSADATAGRAPFTVGFTVTIQDDDPEFDYLWQFGDSDTSHQESPSHTYASVGDYDASVIVTDHRGLADTAAVTIHVGSNRSPVIGTITADQSGLNPGVLVPLSASVSDPDGDALVFTWSQVSGPTISLNGTTGSSTSFTSLVKTTATYRIRLTATDNYSPPASSSRDVQISTRVTYVNTTGSLFSGSCAVSGCHVSGTGRVRLDNYSDVFANRTTIRAKINGGTMSGIFSTGDRDVVTRWIDDGAPN